MSVNLNLDGPDLRQNHYAALAQMLLLGRLRDAITGTIDSENRVADMLRVILDFQRAADTAVNVASEKWLNFEQKGKEK